MCRARAHPQQPHVYLLLFHPATTGIWLSCFAAIPPREKTSERRKIKAWEILSEEIGDDIAADLSRAGEFRWLTETRARNCASWREAVRGLMVIFRPVRAQRGRRRMGTLMTSLEVGDEFICGGRQLTS